MRRLYLNKALEMRELDYTRKKSITDAGKRLGKDLEAEFGVAKNSKKSLWL